MFVGAKRGRTHASMIYVSRRVDVRAAQCEVASEQAKMSSRIRMSPADTCFDEITERSDEVTQRFVVSLLYMPPYASSGS